MTNTQRANQYSHSAKFGVIWSLVSRFGTLFITFMSNLILVRLLMPHDYGTVGLLMVFVAIANTLLDGGLGAALIQKAEPSEDDYSTVFTFNIVFSVILYSILFFTAPFIAEFYKIELLSSILRVQGLVLLINAGRIIQYNLLIKRLQFKKLAIVDVSSATIGALCGILLAKWGFGVWSLVFNNLIYSAVFTLIINMTGKWRPKILFKYSNFRNLFSFGSMLMLSNILDTLYKNIQNVVIGKIFNTTTLGYYTQAKKMEEVPVQGLSSAVNSVFFPIFSNLQVDKNRLSEALCRSINVISYALFAIMTLVILIAEPLINVVYTTKWSDSVPLFQLLCVAGMTIPINMLNLNIVKSLGKGRLFFKLQILQLAIGLASMLIGANWGVVGLICGYIVVSFLFMIFLITVSSSLLNTSPLSQMLYIAKHLAIAMLSGVLVWSVSNIITLTNIGTILTLSLLYMSIYLSLSLVFKVSGLKECLKIIFKKRA